MRKRLLVRRRTRNYYASSGRLSRSWKFIVMITVLASVFSFSGFMLFRYIGDYYASIRVSDNLRQLNQIALQEERAQATAAPQENAETIAQTIAPTATPPASMVLAPIRYPTNYYSIVSSRFRKIQNQNKDIIGWLTIDGLLDEAVVQRDNTYYLRRDYRGYHNQNGAIFLDENCNLKTRPYTLMLFGHNMKTGAMFGSLRNYENAAFYHKNPFITFDSAYENGRYVIFAVSTVSTITGNGKYLDFTRMNSSTIPWRQEALDKLLKLSAYHTPIDVQPDDQLLLLVTCVDDETERRVVAARRIRDGENESDLQILANRTILK